MRMADLLWLENRIQVLHGDDGFGSLALEFISEVENNTLVAFTVYSTAKTLYKRHVTACEKDGSLRPL